jgi:hypothetical protein
VSKTIIREADLETSLCQYPELIDDSLFGIREGMGFLGKPFLARQDKLPNGGKADMVFVEPARITVIEVKKVPLRIRGSSAKRRDVVEQIADYLKKCRSKYPGRSEYRGFIIGSRIQDKEKLLSKIFLLQDVVKPLVFRRDIPGEIKLCNCKRALDYWATICRCGARFSLD